MNIDMGMFAKGLVGFPCVCFSLIRLMNGSGRNIYVWRMRLGEMAKTVDLFGGK